MLKLLPIFLCVAVNLCAVECYCERNEKGNLVLLGHSFPNRKGVAIDHAPQNPNHFPKRGNKKQQRENKRNGRGD